MSGVWSESKTATAETQEIADKVSDSLYIFEYAYSESVC